jgi:hypothetical protein
VPARLDNEPCDGHGAGVACEQQTIVKGEPAHREVAALEATLAVHDDPSIAEGILVQFDLPVVLAEAEVAE